MVTPSDRSSVMPSFTERPIDHHGHGFRGPDGTAALLVLGTGYVWLLLWLAASVSAGAFGGRRSAVPLAAPFLAFTHLANPSSAWGQQEPGPWPYWGVTGAFLLMGLFEAPKV